jgi:hypothetical protein
MNRMSFWAAGLGVLLTACTPSSRQDGAETGNAVSAESAALRERSRALEAELARVGRRLATVEGYAEELDRTLKLASAEIWGQGTSTAQHLSTAQRLLGNMRAEIQHLHQGSPSPRRTD